VRIIGRYGALHGGEPGFWSLAFVYVWTGAHHLLHGPISQWLQTISIVFSVMLLILAWAVVYNFIAPMKGQWRQLNDNVSFKFLMSGTIFYLLACCQGPMHSLRSVNAIVSKTDWISRRPASPTTTGTTTAACPAPAG
jgi:cytochrome c oxidase cbb3-type subunit 1